MKQTIGAKDRELREKQREIDKLYGKLAVGSQLVDLEVRQALASALARLASCEERRAAEGKDDQSHRK